MNFELNSTFKPNGDQPQAIHALADRIKSGERASTLLGVTGSGKTFTIANLIQELQRPTLVISHNKTLAAQLYGEFKEFFPNNAVRYFVSYYDYYQPEAYLPGPDTYIEKDASINEELDRLRLEATYALMERRDTIVVASVSCIYGLGSPENFKGMYLALETGRDWSQDALLAQLVEMQYERGDVDFFRGRFRVKGDVIEIHPAYEEDAYRLDFFGNTLEKIARIDNITGKVKAQLDRLNIYPARHYVVPQDKLTLAIASIRKELEDVIPVMEKSGQVLEAERLRRRTAFDIEMIQELGYCQGIENYSRHMEGRKPGEPPYTLLDYFPQDSLVVIDESHVTIPQLRAMYNGDRARKKNLINYGFRLPSAYDNRPLNFDEFEQRVKQVLYVSATPGPYELARCRHQVVEQLIRPTGLIDPEIIVQPAKSQVDHLIGEIKKRVALQERVLVTTLTKRMAEDLSKYLAEVGIKVGYMHSDIDTLQRIQIIRSLREGEIDCLVGINLLREGLDLPEVSLVTILDADKEGFLRSNTSLIQTIGRAARHVNGQVILYADHMTKSLEYAISETNRRREHQLAYNQAHHITPESIKKDIKPVLESIYEHDYFTIPTAAEAQGEYLLPEEVPRRIMALERAMKQAAKDLDFEKAAELRDQLHYLRGLNPGRATMPEIKSRKKPRRKVSRSVEKRVARRMGRE